MASSRFSSFSLRRKWPLIAFAGLFLGFYLLVNMPDLSGSYAVPGIPSAPDSATVVVSDSASSGTEVLLIRVAKWFSAFATDGLPV